MLTMRKGEGLQSFAYKLGILTVLNGKYTFEKHFHGLHFIGTSGFDLGGNGQKDKIGTGDPIQGCGKGNSNGRSESGWIGQTAKYLNKSHHGSDDPHGWSVPTSGFE